MCSPIGRLPPWFFAQSLPHLLLRNNSIESRIHAQASDLGDLPTLAGGYEVDGGVFPVADQNDLPVRMPGADLAYQCGGPPDPTPMRFPESLGSLFRQHWDYQKGQSPRAPTPGHS